MSLSLDGNSGWLSKPHSDGAGNAVGGAKAGTRRNCCRHAVMGRIGLDRFDAHCREETLRCRIRICVDVGQDVVDHDALASQSLCAASEPDPVQLLYGENSWHNLIYLNDIFDCWRRICDWIDARTYFECAAQN